MNNWTQWYDNLSPSTKKYLQGRAIWTGTDLVKVALIAFIAGVIVGVIA